MVIFYDDVDLKGKTNCGVVENMKAVVKLKKFIEKNLKLYYYSYKYK